MISKLKNMIKKGLVTLDRKNSKGQCSFMETVAEYEAIKPLGFESKPTQDKQPLVCLFNVGANESHKVGIEFDNKNLFKKAILDNGEVVLYNIKDQLSYLVLKNGGESRLFGNKIAIGNSTTELLQKISDLCAETSDLAQKNSEHIHASITGATGKPDNEAAILLIKSNIDTIKGLIDSIKGAF